MSKKKCEGLSVLISENIKCGGHFIYWFYMNEKLVRSYDISRINFICDLVLCGNDSNSWKNSLTVERRIELSRYLSKRVQFQKDVSRYFLKKLTKSSLLFV